MSGTPRKRSQGQKGGGGGGGGRGGTKSRTNYDDEIRTLKADAASMRGRDASIIKADVTALQERIKNDTTLSKAHAKALLKSAKEVFDDVDSEEAMEKACAKFCQRVFLVVTFGPVLLTLLGSIGEWAMRPAMVIEDDPDLTGTMSIVTGACGSVGSEVAVMLAQRGSRVIAACHALEEEWESSSSPGDAEDDGSLDANSEDSGEEDVKYARMARRSAFEDRLKSLQLLRQEEDGMIEEDYDTSMESNPGSVEIWPIELTSFESVRHFATRYLESGLGLDVLVHAASIKGPDAGGCETSGDGYEKQLQTNYLSPFLLSRLLMPSLTKHGGRIVHVVCAAGLQLPDYLPWPLRRVHPSDLPSIHTYMDKEAQDIKRRSRKHHRGECSPLEEYANSKLATVLHSHHLAKRLKKSPKTNSVISVAVDPGALDNAFGRSASKPTPTKSLRSTVIGYFPPVWIFRKLAGLMYNNFDIAGFGLRDPADYGARAVFHVATNAVASGALYSDASGSQFVGCGAAKPSDCGKLPLDKQPAEVSNKKLASKFYKWTMKATKRRQVDY